MRSSSKASTIRMARSTGSYAAQILLEAARLCGHGSDTLLPKLLELYRADLYGTRAHLLTQTALAVDPEHLRRHVESLLAAEPAMERETGKDPARAEPGLRARGHVPVRISPEAIEAALIAQALRDPDLGVRIALHDGREANERQRAQFCLLYTSDAADE